MLTRQQFTELATKAQLDPQPLIEQCFQITTKQLADQPPVVPFIFNRVQRRVHDAIMRKRRAGQPPRIIELKARQPGMSTQGCGYAAATALTRPYSNAAIIAHAEEPTIQLFKKVGFMFQKLPPWLQPKIDTSRRDILSLSHMPCSDADVQLLSSVFVGTAGGQEPWRGQTLQFVHLSEFAFYPWPEDTLAGILPGVPRTPQTLVIIESTANGMGNAFHEEWRRAESGESNFVPIFIGWWEVPEYQMPVGRDFVLEADERELQKAFGLTLEQIQWRRYTIFTDCLGSLDRFNEQYPGSPAEAFLMSGRPAFNVKVLREMYEQARKVHPEQGEINPERLASGDAAGFYKTPKGRMKVFRRPELGHEYTIGADPSQGVEGGDPAAIQVFDRQREEQVAVWHGYLEPYPFAHVIDALGRWYNNAIVAPELNAGHGFSVIEELKALQYPRFYVWQRVDKIRHSVTNWLGWQTTFRTRALLIDSFHYALNAREMLLRDPDTVQQCLEFQYVPGTQRAEGIRHDDLAIAMMIAYRVHLETPMESTGAPPRIHFTDPKSSEPEPPPMPAGSMNQEAWKTADQEVRQMAQLRTLVNQYDTPDPDSIKHEGSFVPEMPW